MSSHMRLPNGFGQISKLNKKLRNPWRAMVTVGQDKETGKYKRKTLGYYKSYNEAYTALLEYHNDPTLIVEKTILDLYDEWSQQHFEKVKSTKMYKIAIERCKTIYNVKLPEVRMRHIREVLEQELPPSSLNNIKTTLSLMFDYAISHEYMTTNYARQYTELDKYKTVSAHIAFKDEEVNRLWQSSQIEFVSIILIGIYTGFRPQELMSLKIENVNIIDWTITGGMKTEAGRDRTVPVHELIKPLVKRWYKEDETYLFRGYQYHHLYSHMIAICEKYNLDPAHKPHDVRKTFVTKCKKCNVDEYAIKKMVGHKSGDLTEDIYTDRDIEWLRSELNKMV